MKRGAGDHTLDCTRCGKTFRYLRRPGRQGAPRTRCFTCQPPRTDLYLELPLTDRLAAFRAFLSERRRGYLEDVESWARFLEKRFEGRRVPSPPHYGDTGGCPACDGLRLLALQREQDIAV